MDLKHGLTIILIDLIMSVNVKCLTSNKVDS